MVLKSKPEIAELAKRRSAPRLGKKIGLLMNFNEPILTKGVKQLVNHFRESSVTPVTSATSAREPGEDPLTRIPLETQKTQRLGVSAEKN